MGPGPCRCRSMTSRGRLGGVHRTSVLFELRSRLLLWIDASAPRISQFDPRPAPIVWPL